MRSAPRCPVDGPDSELGRSPGRTRPSTTWAGAACGWTPPHACRLADLVQLVSEELLTVDAEILGYYARLADQLCRTEIALIDTTKDRQGTLEDMVVGEAVFGEILTLFRRLGHEHYHEQRRRDAVDCRAEQRAAQRVRALS